MKKAQYIKRLIFIVVKIAKRILVNCQQQSMKRKLKKIQAFAQLQCIIGLVKTILSCLKQKNIYTVLDIKNY